MHSVRFHVLIMLVNKHNIKFIYGVNECVLLSLTEEYLAYTTHTLYCTVLYCAITNEWEKCEMKIQIKEYTAKKEEADAE